uniref:DNA/RNA nuclease SfsA n=1 Tax=candidate division WOR-3 bacterium TaxID=2052148 RepID=A0A7C2K5I5_UNCW3
MFFQDLVPAKVIRREKRFKLFVEIDGAIQLAYLPNSGRLGELIYPGAEVFVAFKERPGRKTKYEAVLAKEGDTLVSVNAHLANELFIENIDKMPFKVRDLKREFVFLDSRFDFLVNGEILIEVKSCTLVRDSVGLFPDAPTLRGAKHLKTLLKWPGKKGLIFVIQREDAKYMSANFEMDVEFGRTYLEVLKKADYVLAFKTKVSTLGIFFEDFVPVIGV